jgi:hypothetical protein
LTMHYPALPANLDRSYRWSERSIVASSVRRTSSIAKSVLMSEPVTYGQQRAQVPWWNGAIVAA